MRWKKQKDGKEVLQQQVSGVWIDVPVVEYKRKPKPGDVYQYKEDGDILVAIRVKGELLLISLNEINYAQWIPSSGDFFGDYPECFTYLGKFHEVFTQLPSREEFMSKFSELWKKDIYSIDLGRLLYDWLKGEK